MNDYDLDLIWDLRVSEKNTLETYALVAELNINTDFISIVNPKRDVLWAEYQVIAERLRARGYDAY